MRSLCGVHTCGVDNNGSPRTRQTGHYLDCVRAPCPQASCNDTLRFVLACLQGAHQWTAYWVGMYSPGE